MMLIYILVIAQPCIQSFERKKYFLNLIVTNASVSTISGTLDLIEGSKRANIMLPNGTRFHNILANQQEICLVLKISAKMDIILKL